MSESMFSPTDSDWPQFYQQISNRSVFGDNQGFEEASTVNVSTTITSSNARISPSGSGGGRASSSGGSRHMSPEGRVGKPVRRRTRASRRTPTTLLNTDTKNFRAMVQQFTGAPFAPGARPGGGPNIGFGFGGRQPHVNPSSLMVPPAGFHLQYQQQQLSQFQHQNQPYMFSLNSNNNPEGGDLFLQRLGGNPRPNTETGSEGFVLEGVFSQFPPRNNFLQ